MGVLRANQPNDGFMVVRAGDIPLLGVIIDIKRHLRIYAITGRNKWLAGLLSAVILTQLGLGINVV